MPGPLPLLFTVFEPSGDVLAARLIEEVRRRQPGRKVVAFGGPAMEAAGAELIESTTSHAKMGLGAVTEARELLRRRGVLSGWLKENDLAAHVPTDSPAANWSLCAAVRKHRPGAKVVHLVGPQMWAWAPWRVRKLRRLTDRVLCLLPFEPEWFGSRGVPATFVGHPLFDETILGETSAEVKDTEGEPLRDGGVKLALLPGSRPKEVAANWPTMLRVYDQLRHRVEGLSVAVAAADAARVRQVRSLCPGGRPPRGVQVTVGVAGPTLDWADAALVVSGTATLQAASRRTPAVAVYNADMRLWRLVGRHLIRTRTFALPNVIAESVGAERVMAELIPHDGTPEPVAAALRPLLTDPAERAAREAGFGVIAKAFAGKSFGREAADGLLAEIDG
ncbi:MAG: hypothetical protein AAF710_02875 [Planctomycetota bacterium]